jgi:hypothetical protein
LYDNDEEANDSSNAKRSFILEQTNSVIIVDAAATNEEKVVDIITEESLAMPNVEAGSGDVDVDTHKVPMVSKPTSVDVLDDMDVDKGQPDVQPVVELEPEKKVSIPRLRLTIDTTTANNNLQRRKQRKKSRRQRRTNRATCRATTPSRRTINTSGSVIVQNDTAIAEHCLFMLRDIVPDTSDPDSKMCSPLTNTRHTFLETCQFRRYQFDSLRRAKHSSMMILYHLLNPKDKSIRPKCANCSGIITNVRWHCGDGCADHDVCDACYNSPNFVHPDGHKLVPYRVTFT